MATKGKKRASKEAKEQIVKEFTAGTPAVDIATKHGVDLGTVYRYLRKAGIERKIVLGNLTEEQVNELIKRYSSGELVKHLSVEFGISKNSVHQLLRTVGVPRHQTRKDGIRGCRGCKSEKLITDFPVVKDYTRGGKETISYRCHTCLEGYNQARGARRSLRRSIKKHGISPNQYDLLFEAHGGVCAICKQPDPKGRLSIDHDHATGDIRGLLCRNHNLGIGSFKDNVTHLTEAIKYLNRRTKQ